MTSDPIAALYLHAYDTQLRTEVETPGQISVERHGPLRLVTFPGNFGFITHPHLVEDDPEVVRELVDAAIGYFAARPEVSKVEWKVRGHDRMAGLEDALREHGFAPDPEEAVLIGRVEGLVRGEAPDGVTVRKLTGEADVRAMSAMIDEAFGEEEPDVARADALVDRLAKGDDVELGVGEVDGRMVSGGQLEPVAGTDFVGLWAGATLPEYRGRGIYGAVTTARARSALAMGKTLVHSDSSEDSQPILKRAGMVQVTTTTPWNWRRPEDGHCSF